CVDGHGAAADPAACAAPAGKSPGILGNRDQGDLGSRGEIRATGRELQSIAEEELVTLLPGLPTTVTERVCRIFRCRCWSGPACWRSAAPPGSCSSWKA